MSVQKILRHLEFIVLLFELHKVNPFKIKAFYKAISVLKDNSVVIPESVSYEELIAIKGIGDSIAKVIMEFLQTNNSIIAQEYLEKTPAGILEIVSVIHGLGVKKVVRLWEELHITSVEELRAACLNNRLLTVKGFWKATQEKLLRRIDFYLTHKGYKHYVTALAIAVNIEEGVKKVFPDHRIAHTGALRRQMEVVYGIAFVITLPVNSLQIYLEENSFTDIRIEKGILYAFHSVFNAECVFYYAEANHFGTILFLTTGSDEFLKIWHKKALKIPSIAEEADIFSKQNVPFIPPYRREMFEKQDIFIPVPNIITDSDIKGIIHAHSTFSDGRNTLEEMVKEAIRLGKEYLVISDHSKTSVIANGMYPNTVLTQHKEIDFLNEKYSPFKIFKSVECDILGDGRLDYETDILSLFDLVIVSVHQNLDMTKETATKRIVTALENPYTTILGHPSGRLLLNRKGYDLDYALIIRMCKEKNIVLELNANPYRLDLDWRYLEEVLYHNVMISINPDAHNINGFLETKWGVAVAQKAGVQPKNNLSSYGLTEFIGWIESRKKSKGLI